MALAAVLSAVRALILEVDGIPEDLLRRRSMYGAKFSTLSIEEIEDLAKIPPSALRTYTSTIIHGEKNVLRDLFSGTIERLQRYWQQVYGSPFDLFSFTKDLNRKHPWQGITTLDLAVNVVRYLESNCAALLLRYPEVLEIARFELCSMELRRRPDPADVESSLRQEDLGGLTVSELLEHRLSIGPVVVMMHFSCDLVAALENYYQNDSFPMELAGREILTVASRNQRNQLRWRTIEQTLYDYLQMLRTSGPRLVEDFARQYAQMVGTEVNEEQLFSGFLSLLLGLIDDGVVIVHR